MQRMHRGFGCTQQDAEGDGGVHKGFQGEERGMEKGFRSAKKAAEGDVGAHKGFGGMHKGDAEGV